MGRLLYYLPSGHRTESHIPHLSLPVSLFCAVSHKRSLLFSPLFLHRSSAHSSIPPGVPWLGFFFFSFIPTSLPLLLGELHTVASPLCKSPSAPLSCLPPLPLLLLLLLLPSFSSLLFLAVCFLLARPPLLPWIHAFHVGTFFIHPSELWSSVRCAYLAV